MAAKQILVVEDEKPIRDMIGFALRRAGFDVREAIDVRAARAELANRRPDLLLLDWMLPEMSGIEFTRQLKRDPELRDLPVIMLTARAEESDKVAGLEGVPTTTSPSRFRRANWWRASTRCCDASIRPSRARCSSSTVSRSIRLRTACSPAAHPWRSARPNIGCWNFS